MRSLLVPSFLAFSATASAQVPASDKTVSRVEAMQSADYLGEGA